jgi:serine/threonine-protein kinase
VPKGTVLGTSPSGRAAKGAAITILVSAGPFTSVVPSVQGKKLADAQAALQGAHLTFQQKNVGSDQPVGTVLGTDPRAGTTWPQTKPVTLLVATSLPLPNFSGQNVEAAQQWADQHGVTLVRHDDNNSQQPRGTVTGQEPGPGAAWQAGQTLVVNVSTGPAIVNVPDPIGESVEQATQQLQAQGFQVEVHRFGPFDKVFDFSPVGTAPRGSVITLDAGF